MTGVLGQGKGRIGHSNNAKGGHTSQGKWTDDRVTELRRLVTIEGYSSARAAESLSDPVAGIIVTRNAVVGKARRMGIPLNANHSEPAPRKRAPVERRAPPKVMSPKTDEAIPEPRQAILGPVRRISIMELETGRCHYPLGDVHSKDFAYCGLPVSNRQFAAIGRLKNPYCSHHSAMCYATDPRRSVVAQT